MAGTALVCWKCGADLRSLPTPLSRMAECPACKTELHVCKLCQWYDARTIRQCSEIRAEEVINKERANYCDWFKARPNAFDARVHVKATAAKSKLEGLFGGTDAGPSTEDPARAAAERLFGKDPNKKS